MKCNFVVVGALVSHTQLLQVAHPHRTAGRFEYCHPGSSHTARRARERSLNLVDSLEPVGDSFLVVAVDMLVLDIQDPGDSPVVGPPDNEVVDRLTSEG